MLTKMFAATAALSMLVGGSAIAQSKSSAAVGPQQPIPYSQLNAYMKASPKVRASKDWWAGSSTAATGMSTDTSATAPAASTMSGSSMGSSMGSSNSTGMSVNPPTPDSSSMPSTPPTDGGVQPNGSTLPNPATPTDPMGSSTATPPQPK
ncbi:MAG: hypothetical protein AB1542_14795 [Pseudomonadota bacterium]|jgi:hypothetical protein